MKLNIKRKPLIGLGFPFLLLALTALSGCSEKSEQKDSFRVGVLSGIDFFTETQVGFRSGLAELGYIEGKDIKFDVFHTNVNPPEEQRILKKFIADKVDLIFAYPTEAALAAKELTRGTGIPVLFANANIEGVGLVNSVRQPGGNITGVRFPGPDLAIKRFEIMMELDPTIKRLWVPYQKGYAIVTAQLDVLRPAAKAAGVEIVEAPLADLAELDVVLKELDSGKLPFDAILQIVDPIAVSFEAFSRFAKFAANHNIPVGGAMMEDGENSSIFGVTPKNVAVGKQAALIADQILKGKTAGSIPVVSAESYMVINYKAARKLGLSVSEGLLSRAEKILR